MKTKEYLIKYLREKLTTITLISFLYGTILGILMSLLVFIITFFAPSETVTIKEDFFRIVMGITLAIFVLILLFAHLRKTTQSVSEMIDELIKEIDFEK